MPLKLEYTLPAAARILAILDELADENNEVQISNRDLQERIGGGTVSTVVNAVQKLEREGYVARVPGSGGQGSRYRLLRQGDDVPAIQQHMQEVTTSRPKPVVQAQPKMRVLAPDLVNYLERLAALHTAGNLTDDEFAAAKRKVLR